MKKEKLEDILEKIKRQGRGNYNVVLFYGEEMGHDDINVEQKERNIQIFMTPVGYVGELRKLWKGKLKDLYNFDFAQKPKVTNNPPKEETLEEGYYIWGTDTAIKDYIDNNPYLKEER